MLTVAIDLINHTYGACPWTRAHIEGAIETVPSSTRLLRAMISGAFIAGFGDTPAFKLVLQKLAGVKPIYYIPQGEYVGLQNYRKDQSKDSNLYKSGKLNVEPYYAYAPNDATFLVQWDVDLSEAELVLLQLAMQNIHYLGRSEHRAIWQVNLNHVEFNCYPHEDGDKQVQLIDPDFIESLYISPGVRNAELRSGMPGFYIANYKLNQSFQFERAEKSNSVDSVILATELNYPLPAKDAMYWCDKLHKTLVKKSPIIEKFRNGHIVISPIYEDMHFSKFSLYYEEGFNDADLEVIDSVRCLYSNSGNVNLFVEQAFQSCFELTTEWVSQSPFFLSFYPSLKYSRGGRIRNTGFRLLAGTKFVKNGPEHQVLKCFLRRCRKVTEGITYQEVNGVLGAFDYETLVASCQVEEWPNYWNWVIKRFSGGMSKETSPPVPTGYKVLLKSELQVKGTVSIGYGKNFGLGVLCASK